MIGDGAPQLCGAPRFLLQTTEYHAEGGHPVALRSRPTNMTSPTHKIMDLADIRPGYLTRAAVKQNPEGSHALLQIRDFTPDRTAADFASLTRITPEPRTTVHPLQVGDVLFLAKGARNFAFAVSSLSAPTLAASSFFILRPRPASIVPAYLAWFLNHDVTRAVLTRLSTKGAHMPIIRREIIEMLDIPLPPVTIQKTIVALDTARQQEESLLADLASKQRALVSFITMSAAVGRPILADPDSGQSAVPAVPGDRASPGLCAGGRPE